jgi:hypothetical protein
MRSATVEEAFGFFFRKTAELDTLEPNEAKRGIRGSLAPDAASFGRQPEITLSLVNIPARDALDYITKLAKLESRSRRRSVLGSCPLECSNAEKENLLCADRRDPPGRRHYNWSDGVTYPSVQELFSAFGVLFPDGDFRRPD